jgi:hypothetical protein
MNKNPFESLKSEDKVNPQEQFSVVATLPTKGVIVDAGKLHELKEQLNAQGADIVIIPPGAKGIILRTELNPELQSKVDELTEELKPLSVLQIKTQDDVVKLNVSLKKAKTIAKAVDEERKLITSELDAEKKGLINLGKSVTDELVRLTTLINTNITNFQIEEDRKAKEKAAEIERQKQADLAKIQAEQKRIADIKNFILEFENNVLNAAHSATVADIDSKIAKLAGVKLKPEVYQEFLPEAIDMYNRCVQKMNDRKIELERLAEAEAINAEAAERMKKEQEEKARLEKEAQEQKAAEEQQKIAEQAQESISNVQMESELKSSMIGKQKNVQKRWTVEEETIDMSLLPEEYKTADIDKLKKAVAEGAREIPGVRIFEKIINTSR